MIQTGLFERRVVELQGLRPGQIGELASSYPDLRCNLLEEIRHLAAAALQKLADAVVGVFQDVAQFVLLNADSFCAISHALEVFDRGVR